MKWCRFLLPVLSLSFGMFQFNYTFIRVDLFVSYRIEIKSSHFSETFYFELQRP